MNTSLQDLEQEILAAVRHEVVPALGCTEPICVALAAAIGRTHLSSAPEKIAVRVSGNLMKNAMGVTVPGTGMVGLSIAAAIGAIGGDAEAGLQTLKSISAEDVAAAKKMLADDAVSVSMADTDHIFYAEVTLTAGAEIARVCIADTHTNVVLIEKNGKTIYQKPVAAADEKNPVAVFTKITAKDVFDFATTVDLEKIRFIKEAATLNSALSQEGLRTDYGLHIGRSLQKNIGNGLLSDDLLNRIIIETGAASDARMGGASLPAMSNSGSGNQGIAATMPVVVVARHLKSSEEKTIRALFLSHALAIYIHAKLPTLSSLCAANTAAMGSAGACAWLFSERFEAVSDTICSMIGDVSGMICDGAANSCAMKVISSITSGYKSMLMALDNTRVTGFEGIVEHDLERSINNLCALARESMQHVDQQIIDIMVQKPMH
ncbi:serine dehydratase subunit alpha family protein [Dichelobacter nodosus]|uniref:L-cysteine desulfidase family protein n=1 Tax=Dichelobacter nodosus TaxID=870 RepID=UPI000E294F6E|nr:L-serine ammonia-lyase, iron-sulfur-dependent, subunit alpha [Dichelobacter nodosus]AXM45036.1 serine dehydratase subunit alpha family protein [Dichelobacter nodosus]